METLADYALYDIQQKSQLGTYFILAKSFKIETV